MKKNKNEKINKRHRAAIQRNAKKKKKIAIISIITVLGLAIALVVGIGFLNRNTGPVNIGTTNVRLNQRKPLIADQDLVILIEDITTNALFYPMQIDGYRMEVLVVRASDGTIRTAFNACQSCYASGMGYYVQVGNVLICQNCNMRFDMSQVELQAGGCNPVPIFPENKTQTSETITVPLEHLKQAKIMLESWRS